jgi:hypothetical protein
MRGGCKMSVRDALRAYARAHGLREDAADHFSAYLDGHALASCWVSPSIGKGTAAAQAAVNAYTQRQITRQDQDGRPVRISILLVPGANTDRVSDSDREQLRDICCRTGVVRNGDVLEEDWLQLASLWTNAAYLGLEVPIFILFPFKFNRDSVAGFVQGLVDCVVQKPPAAAPVGGCGLHVVITPFEDSSGASPSK